MPSGLYRNFIHMSIDKAIHKANQHVIVFLATKDNKGW